MESRTFVFVKTDSRGKTKKSDRKLIRSQCMHGKNYRIGVRPVGASPPGSEDAGAAASQERARIPFRQQAIVQRPPSTSSNRAEDRPEDLYRKIAQLHLPENPHPSLADTSNDQTRLHLLRFMVSASQFVYPSDLSIDFNLGKSNAFKWILEDSLYIHFILFFSSALNNAFGRPMGAFDKNTYHHFGLTITTLNQKLARSELEDSTIAVVSSLVVVSAMLTDYIAARAHFVGLQQIVRLRGGLESFRHNLPLYIKLLRVDLAYTLHTGQPPLFIDANSGPPTDSLAESVAIAPCVECDAQLPPVIKTFLDDDRVASVFVDLQRLSCNLNHRHRLQGLDLKLAICSVQHRLLMLDGNTEGHMAETLRLAMLVFLTTTFEMPEKTGQRYPFLTRRFQESCYALIAQLAASDAWNDLLLWLLAVGGMALLGPDEAWLRREWRKVMPAGEEWPLVRRRLKRFLWIDALHDKIGRDLFHVYAQDDGDEAVKLPRTGAWWLSGWGMCPLEF